MPANKPRVAATIASPRAAAPRANCPIRSGCSDFCASGCPATLGDIWHLRPREIAKGRRIDLLWASPDCTTWSRARGGKPLREPSVLAGKRALPWVVTRWAHDVRPTVIVTENVEELLSWSPEGDDGLPDPSRRGLTFKRWIGRLKSAGYQVEWRVLRASDYGAPTSRRRLFVIARCDGRPIVWPEPTHGMGAELLSFRSAAECIDWSLPTPSIFERKKELAPATLARIARGISKFIVGAKNPFIVGEHGHSIIHLSNGERPGQAPRVYDLRQPLNTIVAQGVKQGLVTAYLAKHFGGHSSPGIDLRSPLSTVTCRDHHALVAAFLSRYNGAGEGQALHAPVGTLTTRDRYALVTVRGEAYRIVDIGMRMLSPRELFTAQGFDDNYVIDLAPDGGKLSRTSQVRLVGNSVPPQVAAAIIRANVPSRVLRVAA